MATNNNNLEELEQLEDRMNELNRQRAGAYYNAETFLKVTPVTSTPRESFKNEEVFKDLPGLEDAINTGKPYLFKQISDIDVNMHNEFLKYKAYNANYDNMHTGISYIFITKPKLCLTTDIENSSESTPAVYNTTENGFFKYVAQYRPELIKALIQSHNSSGGSFIKLLSNRYERIDLEDFLLNEKEIAESWKGYNLRLPTTSVSSRNSGTLAIQYDELSDASVLLLHKVWFEYIEKIKFGYIEPEDTTIENKEIDYLSSLYYFMLAPDGETILFWGKYTGLAPKSLPYSAYNSEVGSKILVKANIQYIYQHKEFLEPETLQEFNNVAHANDLISPNRNKDLVSTVSDSSRDFYDAIINDKLPVYVPKQSPKVSGIGFDVGHYDTPGVRLDKSTGKFKLVFYNRG